MLDAMDEAYRRHHLWAYPRLKHLPSEYFRMHGAATFRQDRAGLELAVKMEPGPKLPLERTLPVSCGSHVSRKRLGLKKTGPNLAFASAPARWELTIEMEIVAET